MNYAKLGPSDLNVSRICMGCMGFGAAGNGQHSWTIDETHSREIIRRGLERGINFFDTAIAYQSGTSEQYVGRALRDFARRDEVVVATKFLPRTNEEIEAGISGQEHIRVNGTALKQAQGANAIVDTMSATVIKKHNPGMSDTQLRQLITAHIDEDEFCRYVIQRDINGIALALRETHKDDFFSVPEDNPLKEMLETAGEIVSQDSDTEQAYLAFICKRLKLNFRKLSVEERKWLKKIAEKSDLLKNPKPQRGRR